MNDCSNCKSIQAKLDAALIRLVDAQVENDTLKTELSAALPEALVSSPDTASLASKAPTRSFLKWTWALGILLAVSLAIWVGLLDIDAYQTYNVNSARKSGSGVPVKAAFASYEDLPEIIGASGLVKPIAIFDIKMPLSGKIQTVNVDIGSKVSKGQILAELDKILLMELIKTVENMHTLAQANLNYYQADWQRASKIYSKKFISKIELDRVKNKLNSARFEFIKLKKELTLARYNLKNATILAPTDGIIMQRHINNGENVQKGNIGFTLAEIDPVIVVAQVSEEKIDSVYLGQKADITFSSYPNLILSGTVENINPQTNPDTRTFETYLKVEDPESKLTPGLSAYVRLSHTRKALTIPKLAVIKNAGVASTFVVENSKVRLLPIQTGVAVANKVEVISGLQQDQQVVYYGLLKLKDGDIINLEALK